MIKRLHKKHLQGGWTTAEYIIGLSVLAGFIGGVVFALKDKLNGLVEQLSLTLP